MYVYCNYFFLSKVGSLCCWPFLEITSSKLDEIVILTAVKQNSFEHATNL